jgi:hypothetical protein
MGSRSSPSNKDDMQELASKSIVFLFLFYSGYSISNELLGLTTLLHLSLI